jgi:predicted RNA-binding Zn-ribbon protein involved in translation (DUF1610 family)
MMPPPLRRAFTIGFLISIALLAVIGIAYLLLPSLRFQEEILLSCLLATGFNFVAAAHSFFFAHPRLRWLAWEGLAAAVVCTLILIFMIWFPMTNYSFKTQEILGRTAGVTATLAVWPMLTGLFLMLPLFAPWAKRVRIMTVVALAVFAVQLLWLAADDPSFEDLIRATIGWDRLGRFNGVIGILLGTGFTTMIVMSLVERRGRIAANESVERRVSVHLSCPRCGHEQSIRAGNAPCSSCGLRIAIEVQEPRCVCGYLLHELKGDTCPECGRTIPRAERVAWTGSREFKSDASTRST